MRNESRRELEKSGTVFTVRDIKPRYLVWENVVGAYSSGTPEGADFQAVLEEIARVVLNEVPTIPIPTDGWPYAGNLEGVGEEGTPFSICWRTHDAQYWGKTVIDNCGRVVKAGTPQRRRRIALVADFGGSTAPEILFEREGLSGNTEQSGETRQGTPGTVGEGVEKSSTNIGVNSDPVQKTYKKDAHAKTSEDGQGCVETDVNDTLNAFDNGETRTPTLVFDMLNLNPKADDKCQTINAYSGTGGNNMPLVYENHSQDTRYKELGDACTEEPILLESSQNHATVQTDGVSTTLPAAMGEGGGYVPMVVEGCDVYNQEMTGDVASTVTAACGGTNTSGPKVLVEGFDAYNHAPTSEVAKSLNNKATDSDHIPVVYGFEPGIAQRVDPENRFSEEVSPTLRAKMGDNQASVVYSIDQQGGKGTAAYSENVAPTMASDSHGTPHAVCYGMSALDSNAMKSSNPHSGIYEADTSRTLDLNGGNPGCNQGGMIVLEGNGSRPSHKGDGYSESETMYTLNTTEQHAVCVSNHTSEKSVEGVDVYNFATTGEVGRTIATAGGGLNEHIPCVIEDTDRPIKESVKTYGVTTKGNGDAFISEERHTSLSTGGGEAGQGYPCVLTEQTEPEECLNGWDVQSKHIQSEDGVAESLYSGECRYGGGESYVMQKRTYQDTTGSLCAAGYSKLGTQEASNDMYVVQEPTSTDSNVITMTDVGFVDVDENGTAFTLRARDYKSPQCVAIDMGGGKSGCGISEEQASTLTTTHGGEPVVYGFKPDQGSKAHGMGFEEEKSPTLSTCNNAGVLSIENHPNDSRIKVRDDGTVQTLSSRMGTGGNNTPMVMATEPQAFSQNQREEIRDLGVKAGAVSAEHGTHQQTFVSTAVVRRLTPVECELLQGFPKNWTFLGEWVDTQGKKHKDSDSARYKALGNSIALPFWDWMAGRMCDKLRQSKVEHPTMASLFDGISGFPLVYARHGCTPVWSSEIEEFPIAVCKKHFGDDATGEKGDYEQYLHQTEPFYATNTSGPVYGLDRASFNQGQNALYDFSVEEDKAQTIVARGPGGVCQ